MWTEIADLNVAVLVALDEHERLCASSTPDLGLVANLSWRIGNLSRQRSDQFSRTTLRETERIATGELARRLRALMDGTPDYRLRISAFISKWTGEAVRRDWAGYKVDSAAIRAMVRNRLDQEAAIIKLVPRKPVGKPGAPITIHPVPPPAH